MARIWPVSMFPETKKETRGSPALFVSGNFQGNQRVFGAPFWQLSSFPESESWSAAKSEAKPRKPAKYQVFSRFPRFRLRFCPRPALRLRENSEFPEWSTKHPLFSLEISGNAKCWGPSVFLFVFRKTVLSPTRAQGGGTLRLNILFSVWTTCPMSSVGA